MSKVAMGLEDVLFAADLRGSVVPIIGGLPTFTRNGIAFGKSIESHERIHMIDTPRITPDECQDSTGREAFRKTDLFDTPSRCPKRPPGSRLPDGPHVQIAKSDTRPQGRRYKRRS